MTHSVQISSIDELKELRNKLRRSASHAKEALRRVSELEDPLNVLKFEKLGCDPFDVSKPDNLAEQIDQQATHGAAVDGLEKLMKRHPGKIWTLAAGVRGNGHDIVSHDREVAAEIFAAVRSGNNRKLKKDIEKIQKFSGNHKYVIYRSPDCKAETRIIEGVTVISLGMKENQ